VIRINLLNAERKAVKKARTGSFGSAQKMVLGCGAILLITAGVIGWRYLAVARDSAQLDAEIANAQKETARLHSVISQVQQFEQRRAQLQQRVSLIEQLRKEQTGPVHMLDEISRALPPLLWLTQVKQTANPNEVLIDGRSTTITGVSDFVAALEASGYFKKSIEIVSSTTQPLPKPPGELVAFQLKAIFQRPSAAKPAPAAAAGAAAVGASAAQKGN
jgi:type IV pilus assembly protein PilN